MHRSKQVNIQESESRQCIMIFIHPRDATILKYCYIAIFFATIQYNTADLGYRFIAHCNILLYIANPSDEI